MKQILTILIMLCAGVAFGQATVSFGASRTTDTSNTIATIKAPKYASSDTNKVLGVTSTGVITLRTKTTSSGGSTDSTTFTTNYRVDTAKTNLRTYTATKQDALGFTPVTNARTLTINGTTYDLTANRTWTISVPYYADSILRAFDSIAAHNTRIIAVSTVSVTPTANAIVRRDANANAYVNNLIQNGTSTVAANGTTAMTLASTLYQEQTGSSGNDQTYVLPDATTLTEFTPYVFDNNSDNDMIVKDHTNVTIITIGAGGKYEVRLKDNGSVAGTWDKHPYLPLGTNATTAGIQFTGFVSASGSVTGSNLSGTNTGDQTNGYGLNLSVSTFSVDTATLFSKYTTTLGAGSGISISGRTITATGGTGTVTSVATNTGTGITGGTITSSGTIAADTTVLGTRAWRDKLKDSLNINIAAKGSGTVTNVIGGTNISITGTSTIQPTVNITGTIAVANGGTGTTSTTSVNTTPITYGANNTVTASAATLTTTTLNPTVVTSSLTAVGVVTSGTWSSTIGSAATGSTQAINNNSTQIATTAYADRYHPVDTTISAAYTLTSRDFYRTIHCTNASNIALTIPSGLGTTFTCVVLAEGAGTVTPTTSSTTFYYQPTSTTKIKSQGGATIRSWATANSYLIIGSLE